MSTTSQFLFIDFESIQPDRLTKLIDKPIQVIVFVGANQNKIPFDVANAMQQLGGKAQYIKIASQGRNALDFHICYYLGHFAINHSDAEFYILSRDTGFDPLICHLVDEGQKVMRVEEIETIYSKNAEF